MDTCTKVLKHNCFDCPAGSVFYYRSKAKVYGCVFLFRQQDFRLIAISEEIIKKPSAISVEDIIRSPLYTIAWFSDDDLLRRLHCIGTVNMTDDYSNRAGLLIDSQGNVLVKNAGQSATWKHEFRAYSLHNTIVEDVLNTRFIPKTVS